jgi:hypothetical protein
MLHERPPKAQADVFIGFFPSESNPPNMVEFLDAAHCMAKCLLDKVVYAVVDVESSDDDYSFSTRTHRLAMAKSAASMFGPLIQVFDPFERSLMTAEEAAFRLFDLNSDMRFTLFYISTVTETFKRANVIERLATNIVMRLHGFDPNMHKVVAAFLENRQEQPVELNETAKRLVDEDLFGVIQVKGHGVELSHGNAVDKKVLEAIRGEGNMRFALLAPAIARYLSDHQDYRRRLADHLSAKLGLQS